MTKKDYILIAGAIREGREIMRGLCLSEAERDCCDTTARAIANELARALRSENARFDDIRFMRAAIVDSE